MCHGSGEVKGPERPTEAPWVALPCKGPRKRGNVYRESQGRAGARPAIGDRWWCQAPGLGNAAKSVSILTSRTVNFSCNQTKTHYKQILLYNGGKQHLKWNGIKMVNNKKNVLVQRNTRLHAPVLIKHIEINVPSFNVYVACSVSLVATKPIGFRNFQLNKER